MKFLCIFAVLLSVVAARPDPSRPWRRGGPFARGPGGPRWEPNFPGRPTGPGKLPPGHPGRPSHGAGHGCSQMTTVGAPVSDPQTTGAPPVTSRGDKSGAEGKPLVQVGETLATTSQTQTPGRAPVPGPGAADMDLLEGFLMGGTPLEPGQLEKQKFIPIFKADNVSFENVTGLHLKEGENIYLLPKDEKQPPMPKESKMNGLPAPASMYGPYGMPYQRRPQPYLKVVLNPTATATVI
ncbi:collagen alpha-1(VII) chain-like [Gadus chalcogrammus]|uniref:collagen alpha-1(VII) chain-like n=1 Tax=Gadus chalcogrammus TaxID=1042646 RepID=UPI0024C29963|nr:collagen alpha-1(VII) chain-like [Gadus chalcogrammus]